MSSGYSGLIVTLLNQAVQSYHSNYLFESQIYKCCKAAQQSQVYYPRSGGHSTVKKRRIVQQIETAKCPTLNV